MDVDDQEPRLLQRRASYLSTYHSDFTSCPITHLNPASQFSKKLFPNFPISSVCRLSSVLLGLQRVTELGTSFATQDCGLCPTFNRKIPENLFGPHASSHIHTFHTTQTQ